MARTPPEKPFNGGTWTKARMFSFIRSNIRKMSMKWPPINQALNAARRPSQSKNKLLRWEYFCCECKKWYPRKEVQAEHIIPCGSLSSFEDIGGFIQRMLVEKEGISVKCKACHQIKTNEERNARRANKSAS